MSVDIDEDTLIAARKNSIINGVQDIMDVVHTRIVYVGEIRFPVSDITVANILPGPLSMLAATLWSFTKPGGLLCLSGIKPYEITNYTSYLLISPQLSPPLSYHETLPSNIPPLTLSLPLS
jgi:ribosomal protein L11 methylase PrmA